MKMVCGVEKKYIFPQLKVSLVNSHLPKFFSHRKNVQARVRQLFSHRKNVLAHVRAKTRKALQNLKVL